MMSCDTSRDQSETASENDAPQKMKVDKGSYREILKSSALIGGSSALSITIGIVRTKAMAVFLGPAGFGLFGLYGSVVSLYQAIAGMGVSSSGVRQIAYAAATGDSDQIALTISVLRRASLFLGLAGAMFVILFSRLISTLTFGSGQHAGSVALLSLAVLFQTVSGGQSALLQGMRRVADFAKISVIGAALGVIVAVPVIYIYRENGVAPSLVVVAILSMAVSWWYSRKIKIPFITPESGQVWHEGTALLKLGFVFMLGSLMTLGNAYFVRVIILRKTGYLGAGLFQSAWTLGGMYVAFILQAMGADFYPRLTASADEHSICNRLVNEQTEVGMLLAGPGVLATLALAPVAIFLFYSSRFGGAVEILRWICLGGFLQVVTWPMSFVLVAKGKQWLFFLTELAWAMVSLGLTWIGVQQFGLRGAGAAFLAAYVCYGVILLPIIGSLTGFCWSASNRRTGAVFFVLIGVSFCSYYVFPFAWAIAIGSLAAAAGTIYAFRVFISLINWEHIPKQIKQLFAIFHLAPATASDPFGGL